MFVFLLAAMTLGGVYYQLVLTMLPMHLAANGWRGSTGGPAGGLLAGLAFSFGAIGQ